MKSFNQNLIIIYMVTILAAGMVSSVLLAAEGSESLKVVEDQAAGRFTVTDGVKPVLTYNFNIVPVPASVTGKYAVARCDYIHPLYGPGGEVLTKDYSSEHPHHRGIYWAWPEVTWKGETRDLHALQGIFARPVKIVRKDITNGCAVLETENVWKWGDKDSIVREFVTITVSRVRNGKSFIDFEFRFQALVEGVTVARRGKSHYGGFNIRLSARADQKIVKHIDPAGQPSRQAWACIAGVPPDGKQVVSLVILQNKANPEYPGDWIDYPDLNWLQPTFPSKGAAYALKMDSPLVLRYRLIVNEGDIDATASQELWAEYNKQTGDRE